MTWSEILSKSEASSTFKATFLVTAARYDQKKAKDYSDQCYHWFDRCGYRIERIFIVFQRLQEAPRGRSFQIQHR